MSNTQNIQNIQNTQNTEGYIINKKYKSLVKDILSHSKLPSYFLSHDFILYLMKFSTLLLELNLCPTEYNFLDTVNTLFFVFNFNLKIKFKI